MDNDLAIIAVNNSDIKMLSELTDYNNKEELLRIALRNNDLAVIKFIVNNTSKYCLDLMSIIDSDELLCHPIDQRIFRYLVMINRLTPDRVAYYAIDKWEKELFIEMLEMGAKHLDWLACRCAYVGNEEFLDTLIGKGAGEFNWIVEFAVMRGDLQLVKKLVVLGANDMNNIAMIAAFNDKMDILRFAIDNGANNQKKISYIASLMNVKRTVDELK